MQFVALEFLCVQFQNFLLTFFGNYGFSSIWTILLQLHFKVLNPLLQNTHHPPSNQVKVKAIHSF